MKDKLIVFVSGVTGQDGSYMVDFLLDKFENIKVYGGIRRLSVPNHKNIKHINDPRFELVYFDLTDTHSLDKLVRDIKPHYFINFAAQSFVGSSWTIPIATWDAGATSIVHILEAVREHSPRTRVYNAGSSEEFGDVQFIPQSELHPIRPRSPYGAAKAASRHIVKVYRESYGIYAVQGWLFNHESERRGEEFVTRKITQNVARINQSIQNGNFDFAPLELGNIDAQRDWSHAEDFVRGVWMMLNQDEHSQIWKAGSGIPIDYVLSSGHAYSVRYFVERAFAEIGIKGTWVGQGVDEEYRILHHEKMPDSVKGRSVTLMKVNPKFYRPAEVDFLKGYSMLARTDLGWQPEISFEELVKRMVENDIRLTLDEN